MLLNKETKPNHLYFTDDNRQICSLPPLNAFQIILLDFLALMAQSAWAAEYTDSFSAMSRYVTKKSDGEASVILGLGGIWSTPLLLSLPGPLCPGVVVPDRVLSIG